VPITAGQVFDRYGGPVGSSPTTANGNPNLGGQFTSPVENGTPFTFGERALREAEDTYGFYYQIEVLKDLPFTAQNADVIPWYGQVGGGQQSMWNIPKNPSTGYPYSLSELAEMGLIKITILEAPNGVDPGAVNTVIK